MNMTQRERQIPNEIFDLIPTYVKESFEHDSDVLRQFATNIVEAGQPPMPRMGEMTTAGNARLFSPISPFNAIYNGGLYTSADIPLNVLDMMRRDSQIALGMAIVKFPITKLRFTINCKNPLIKEFVKYNLENKWATIVKDSLKALDFGFVAFEKVWKHQVLTIDPGKNQRKIRGGRFLTLSKLKPLHPSTVSVRVDNKGNFAGLNQNSMGKNIELPRNKSMMITNDEEFGNYFGRSRLVSAYEAWYWKQISTQFLLRYTERFSIPPYKITFPPGITRFANGTQLDNAEIAMNMATAISSYGNVAVPFAVDDKGNRKWNIESMDQGRLNVKPSDLVGFWNANILRGLLIPDKESLDAMDPDTASEVYLSTLESIVRQIEEKINLEVIKPLVYWNFDLPEREDCTINIDDIDFKKRSETRKLMSKLVDLSATFLKQKGGLPYDIWPDMQKIYENLDVPFKDIKIFVPPLVDENGNPVSAPKPKKSQGPDKGEKTPGNKSREGRGGEPRDEDKEDAIEGEK
jgi:hypothetical protein